MLHALKELFSPASTRLTAHRAYLAIVAQARRPFFYRDFAVPDTVDGRFDVIVLHVFLLIHRLRRESAPEAESFIRALSEVFFDDMDRSLREMGSTDTGVGIRVKKMAKAFYGRLQHYEASLHEPAALKACLQRNLYRSLEENPNCLDAVAEYMRRNADALGRQDTSMLLQGEVPFLD